MRRRNKGEGMQDGILTPSSELLQEFQEIGRDLFVSSLISSHGGNMSVRRGNSIIITRHGSMLGRLKDGTLIETKDRCTTAPSGIDRTHRSQDDLPADAGAGGGACSSDLGRRALRFRRPEGDSAA